MNDDMLRDQARSLGLSTQWTDHTGQQRDVTIEALRAIIDRLAQTPSSFGPWPPMLTHSAGEPLRLPSTAAAPSFCALTFEDGETIDLPLEDRGDGYLSGPPIERTGYHQLFLGGRIVMLAVAPSRCFTVEDATQGGRAWGLAAQVYGLRRQGDGGIGDFAGVSTLAQQLGHKGADALALSPTHALFHADPSHYSPYSPSTRLFRNPLHADLGATFDEARLAAAIQSAGLADQMNMMEAQALIDWPQATKLRHGLLRALYDSFRAHELSARSNSLADDFRRYCRDAGDALSDHARFETLHADYFNRDFNRWHWHAWSSEHRDARGAGVTAYALQHRIEIEYHAFLQWVSDRSQAACQRAATASGMRIGLIGDLAVGMNSGGSQSWSRPQEILSGLAIGAPPDPLAPRGQNWGLTTFSPQGLKNSGFEGFIATLRGMFRHAGGIRVDHVMGLSRLWLVPEGADASEGAYLNYPFDDLLRLTALESWRHRAIVIGEDLGTVPHGFRERIGSAGLYGLRVMQFERNTERFYPPHWYQRDAVAMTSTHDLPTIAGWWRGRDLVVREELQQFGPGQTFEIENAARAHERSMLVSALSDAGVIEAAPPQDIASDAIVRASAHFLAQTASHLTLLPVEDAIGQVDQPNLPGTTVEHPNWRRRYEPVTQELLASDKVQATLNGFAVRNGAAKVRQPA